MVKWEAMWEGPDSQDVGVEAAIILRKRNSSLGESACAEDVTGLNRAAKLGQRRYGVLGRGGLCTPGKVWREACWRYQKCEC